MAVPVDLVFEKYEPSNGPNSNKLPLVLGHGLFLNKEDWGDIPVKLAEQSGRTIFVFDLRDHGDSPRTEEFSFTAMTSDVLRFLSKNSISKAAFCGHSLSGMLFSRFATQHNDRVEKLIMIDVDPAEPPPFPLAAFTLQLKEILATVREKVVELTEARKYVDEQVKELIKDDKKRTHFLDSLLVRDGQIDFRYNIDCIAKQAPELFGFNDLLPEFSGSSLEIYGSKSIRIKERIPGILERLPNCKFVEIPDSDHEVPFTHPERVIEAIVQFLED